jgi:hypothetical protein
MVNTRCPTFRWFLGGQFNAELTPQRESEYPGLRFLVSVRTARLPTPIRNSCAPFILYET